MPARPRSRKARIAELRGQLQSQGHDMAGIAGRISRDEHVTPRAAWRLACGLSQQQVADRYNALFPPGSDTALITAKQVSYSPTGKPGHSRGCGIRSGISSPRPWLART